jgi:hypothetical protein
MSECALPKSENFRFSSCKIHENHERILVFKTQFLLEGNLQNVRLHRFRKVSF